MHGCAADVCEMFRSMPKHFGRACVLASMLALALAATASAQTRALFSTQQLGSSGLTQYSIDLETGALTQQGPITASGDTPTVPGISPDGSRIYVSGYNDNQVHGFSIGTGGLTALSGFPVNTGGGPNETVVSPSGNSLWTANNVDGTVSAFSVDSAGGLTEAGGSPFSAGGGDTALAVSPNQSLMYTAGYGSNQIAGLLIGPGAGLSPASGFPLAHSGTPIDVEYNVPGNVLYVANYTDDNVSAFSINTSTGALTELSGSPFAAGDAPSALAASADGKWLFVANGADSTIQSFSVGSDGALTPAGGPVSTQTSPNDLTVTPDSRFVYTADYWGGWISGFAIGAGGSLSALAGSPFGDNSGTVASVAIVPDQGPTASFSSTIKDSTISFDASASSDPDGTVASYVWDFGDGSSALNTSSPSTTYTYANPGTYTPTLRVIDNENCSNVQIGTGQSLACNGAARAVATQSVTALPLLTLKHATGKQLTSLKRKGKAVRRVQLEYFLNRNATVSYQFQKSTSKGRCRKSTTKKKGSAKYRNFGKKTSDAGTLGRDRRTFTSFGGKAIVPGRYRALLKATAPDSAATPTTTSASFCVN